MALPRALVITWVMFVACQQGNAQPAWELTKDNDGIRVYTRAEKGSAYKSFKAVARFHASAKDIVDVLRDADRYADWYGFTKTAKLLTRENDVQYHYVETIFPWPYQNRDLIYKMWEEVADAKMIILHVVGIPDFLPQVPDVVRMKKAQGQITLTAVTNNETEVVYEFHSEPGDNIPPWLANRSISELPWKTLSGLRKVLSKRSLPMNSH